MNYGALEENACFDTSCFSASLIILLSAVRRNSLLSSF